MYEICSKKLSFIFRRPPQHLCACHLVDCLLAEPTVSYKRSAFWSPTSPVLPFLINMTLNKMVNEKNETLTPVFSS